MTRNMTERKGNEKSADNSNRNEEKDKSGIGSGLEALVLIPQLGLNIAIPIILGAAAGHWIDGKLGTGMIFSMILLFLGIADGIFGAYRLITTYGKWKK